MSCGCGCNGSPGGCGGHDHEMGNALRYGSMLYGDELDANMGASISYMPIEMGRTRRTRRRRNPMAALTPRTALVLGALLGSMAGFYIQRKVKLA